jgi:quinol monooxygenase YgiN
MSECIVVAIIRPFADSFDEVLGILQEVTAQVHQEQGCELYALNEGVEGELVFVEKWSSRDAWQEHMDGPAVGAIGQRISHLLESPPEIHELYAVPVGNVSQGRL